MGGRRLVKHTLGMARIMCARRHASGEDGGLVAVGALAMLCACSRLPREGQARHVLGILLESR